MGVDFENLNVLVVADPLPLKILLLPVLGTIGVNNILTSGNATEGVDLFFRHSPDLVLADWYMALSNGIELTKKIRRVSSFPKHRTPVILMTGDETAPSAMTQAQDAGATGLLLKPFSAEDLIKLISITMSDTREFIENPGFIGPDRRKKILPDPAGPLRRRDDRRDHASPK